MKTGLIIWVTVLFIVTSVAPLTFGNNISDSKERPIVENYDKYLYPESYNCYNISEIPDYEASVYENPVNNDDSELAIIESGSSSQPLVGPPMDSPWPMYCHDVRHTGRSPYNSADNPGDEKWRCPLKWEATGGIAIDNDGTIYIGSDGLYAIRSNGTLKWKFTTNFKIHVTPAIDEDGIIYAGIIYGDSNLFALYPDGTLKWRYYTGDIFSSPTIDENGTIYFAATDNWNIIALYPNGTLKWEYHTNEKVYSSPAIGKDGTIYCGSFDNHLYALYSNNGSLKWKYNAGGKIRTSPCIADDGTIYVVSVNELLHAVYPNGTKKWTTNIDGGTSPTIGQDGTIYAGYRILHAINPADGSMKWTFNPGSGRSIQGATPCNSIDGIIYFGTHIGETDGGELIAVNPDGTEQWRIMLATTWIDSAPAIGGDGTIYVGSCNDMPPSMSWGYLHAIGKLDPDAPIAPTINGQTSGNVGSEYEYKFKSISPLGRDVYYYIEWGDGEIENWIGPNESGEEVTASHKWLEQGKYTIKARAKDTDNLWGPWSYFEVEIPRNKVSYNPIFLRFIERFPILREVLSFLLNH